VIQTSNPPVGAIDRRFPKERTMQRPLNMLDENFISFLEKCGFDIRDGHAFVQASISSSDDGSSDGPEIEVYVSRSKREPGKPTRLVMYLPNNMTLRADLTNATLDDNKDEDETNNEEAA
jgi:hypothetical protein